MTPACVTLTKHSLAVFFTLSLLATGLEPAQALSYSNSCLPHAKTSQLTLGHLAGFRVCHPLDPPTLEGHQQSPLGCGGGVTVDPVRKTASVFPLTPPDALFSISSLSCYGPSVASALLCLSFRATCHHRHPCHLPSQASMVPAITGGTSGKWRKQAQVGGRIL